MRLDPRSRSSARSCTLHVRSPASSASAAVPPSATKAESRKQKASTLLTLPGAPSDLTDAGYTELDGSPFSALTDLDGWWARSGTQARDADHFHLPTSLTDPFGQSTEIAWHGSTLFPASVTDPLSNQTSATIDLRTLQPFLVTDPNGDRTELAIDALGRVTAMALTGQSGGSDGHNLSSPTAEFAYDLDQIPASAWGRARETHGVAEGSNRWIETTSCSDGAGKVVMQKITTAPDGNTPRWVGSGRVILNNKGLPIKQYEPFYSETDAFDAEEGFTGVTPVITYDPLGRAIAVDLPDGNRRSVAFGPWSQTTWDEADNESEGDHEGTPTTVHLDVLGRPWSTVEILDESNTPTTSVTRHRRVRHLQRAALPAADRGWLRADPALDRRIDGRRPLADEERAEPPPSLRIHLHLPGVRPVRRLADLLLVPRLGGG